MKKQVLAVALLALCGAANAGWTPIATVKDPSASPKSIPVSVSVDLEHLKKDHDKVFLWSLEEYSEGQASGLRSTIALEQYDCTMRVSGVIQMRQYAEPTGKGVVLGEKIFKNGTVKFMPVARDGPQAQLFNMLCHPN